MNPNNLIETPSPVSQNTWRPRNQSMASIRSNYAAKLRQIQAAAHLAHARGDARQAIIMIIELVCEESMMLNDMAWCFALSPEKLANERVIRRADIDVLMVCGVEADDTDAKLLAQVLLEKHQSHCTATVAEGSAQGH